MERTSALVEAIARELASDSNDCEVSHRKWWTADDYMIPARRIAGLFERVGAIKHNGAGELLFKQSHPGNLDESWVPVLICPSSWRRGQGEPRAD